MNTEPVRQRAILDKWLPYLKSLPYVTDVFLEGSLVNDTGHAPSPASDIDIRIVVDDTAFDYLTHAPDNNWRVLFQPLAYRLSVNASGNRGGSYHFVRVITDNGVVIDLDIYRQSGAASMKSVIRPPAETWPAKKTITPNTVRQQTTDFAVVLAAIPCSFYSNEFHSTQFQLDLYYIDLVKLMYDVAGVDYARRYKHFTELFPDEWLGDLDRTYSDSISFLGLAYSMIELWRLVGIYLQKLSDKVGGGFDPDWYWPIYETVKSQLQEFA